MPVISGYWCPGMHIKSESETLYTTSILEPYNAWRYNDID